MTTTPEERAKKCVGKVRWLDGQDLSFDEICAVIREFDARVAPPA